PVPRRGLGGAGPPGQTEEDGRRHLRPGIACPRRPHRQAARRGTQGEDEPGSPITHEARGVDGGGRGGGQDAGAGGGGGEDGPGAGGRLVEASSAGIARRQVCPADTRSTPERGADPRLGAGLPRGEGEVAQCRLTTGTLAPRGELEAARRVPAPRLARLVRR